VRSVRFPSAFAAALGAHTAVALALVLVPQARATVAIAPSVPGELFIVTEESPPPVAVPVKGAAVPEPPLPGARSRKDARPAAASREPMTATVDVPLEPAIPPPADGYGRLPAPGAPIDLGIGAYWKSVALGPAVAEAPAVASAEPPPPSIEQILRDPLEARDHELGLGAGGPLVAAAREAASLAFAPDTGTATFDIESDAEGRVMSATIVSVGGDAQAWGDVARQLVSLMSSKRLHVPHGAHGFRARLRISADRTLPAGEKTSSTVGAVPDDVAGGDTSCVGEGIHRKCTAGSPVGMTGSWGDLSNLGARATRIIRAQIVSERTF
jgi:hypothetical protein